jgi:hypothetical protein
MITSRRQHCAAGFRGSSGLVLVQDLEPILDAEAPRDGRADKVGDW